MLPTPTLPVWVCDYNTTQHSAWMNINPPSLSWACQALTVPWHPQAVAMGAGNQGAGEMRALQVTKRWLPVYRHLQKILLERGCFGKHRLNKYIKSNQGGGKKEKKKTHTHKKTQPFPSEKHSCLQIAVMKKINKMLHLCSDLKRRSCLKNKHCVCHRTCIHASLILYDK